MTLPDRGQRPDGSRGGYGPPPTGGPGFGGGQPDAKTQKAMQACAKLRPQGQFRGGYGSGSRNGAPQQSIAAFTPYLTCLQARTSTSRSPTASTPSATSRPPTPRSRPPSRPAGPRCPSARAAAARSSRRRRRRRAAPDRPDGRPASARASQPWGFLVSACSMVLGFSRNELHSLYAWPVPPERASPKQCARAYCAPPIAFGTSTTSRARRRPSTTNCVDWSTRRAPARASGRVLARSQEPLRYAEGPRWPWSIQASVGSEEAIGGARRNSTNLLELPPGWRLSSRWRGRAASRGAACQGLVPCWTDRATQGEAERARGDRAGGFGGLGAICRSRPG